MRDDDAHAERDWRACPDCGVEFDAAGGTYTRCPVCDDEAPWNALARADRERDEARALAAQALATGLAERQRLQHVVAVALEARDLCVCTDCGAIGDLSGWGCLPPGWTPSVCWAVLGADPVRCPACSPPPEPDPPGTWCEACDFLACWHMPDCPAALAEGPPEPPR